MGILDAMFGIADFFIDIWRGIRFGFTSVAWGWLGGICLIAAIECFALSWPIPGLFVPPGVLPAPSRSGVASPGK